VSGGDSTCFHRSALVFFSVIIILDDLQIDSALSFRLDMMAGDVLADWMRSPQRNSMQNVICEWPVDVDRLLVGIQVCTYRFDGISAYTPVPMFQLCLAHKIEQHQFKITVLAGALDQTDFDMALKNEYKNMEKEKVQQAFKVAKNDLRHKVALLQREVAHNKQMGKPQFENSFGDHVDLEDVTFEISRLPIFEKQPMEDFEPWFRWMAEEQLLPMMALTHVEDLDLEGGTFQGIKDLYGIEPTRQQVEQYERIIIHWLGQALRDVKRSLE
jgi:hypothetical protein